MTTPEVSKCDFKAALRAQGNLFLQLLGGLAVALLPLLFMGGALWWAVSSTVGQWVVAIFFWVLIFGFLGVMVAWGVGWVLYKLFQPLADLGLCLLKERLGRG